MHNNLQNYYKTIFVLAQNHKYSIADIENLVPFEGKIEYETPNTKNGKLVFIKDNPSGLDQHADQFRVTITFR